MITKIVSYSFLAMLFFAFFLAILGVKQITTGEEYYNFMSTVSQRYESWSVAIPDIPKINKINSANYDSSGLILSVLIKIANFFVNFINIISSIINILISILNIIIELIQFVCTFLWSMKDFIGRLADLNTEARTIV